MGLDGTWVKSTMEMMESIIESTGIDMNDDNFKDTPSRFLKYLNCYVQPYNPKKDLETTFKPEGVTTFDNAMIVQVGIPYRAICAHHLLPVLGTAHVGYIPNAKVVGLSKLSRLVHGITHRTPSLQENICNDITVALERFLEPLGSMCVISAEHGCMAARGVEVANVNTVTSSIKGVFIHKPESRDEFYKLVEIGSA